MIRTGCMLVVILLGLGIAFGLRAAMKAEREKLAKESRLLDDARAAKIVEAAGAEAAVPGPVKLRGTAVAERPATLSLAGERVDCVHYEVKLVQRWKTTEQGKTKDQSRTVKTWNESRPFQLDDGSGPRLRVDPARAKLYLRNRRQVVVEADGATFRDGALEAAIERKSGGDTFELAAEWLPVGATVLAVGLVAEGEHGPELAAVASEPMIVSAYDEAGTREAIGTAEVITSIAELIGYGIGGALVIVGIFGMLIFRGGKKPPAPPPPPAYYPPPAPPQAPRGFDVS